MDNKCFKCSPRDINDFDFTPFELGVVQLEGILNILLAGKLHSSLILVGLVSINPGDLPSRPHELLQVLPAGTAGEVVHNDPELRAGALLPPVLGSPGVPSAAARVAGVRNKTEA